MLRFYLQDYVAPRAKLYRVRPGDSAEAILRRFSPPPRRFWFHIDWTVTRNIPAGRAELLAALRNSGAEIVNGDIVEVSKRSLHQFNRDNGFPCLAAGPEGDPGEPIIVKTNCNYGGSTERAVPAFIRRRFGLDRLSDSIRSFDQYRVLPRKDVPAAYWTDPSLVCERYIECNDGIWYRAYLMKPNLAICEYRSKEKVKKVGASELVRTIWMRTGEDPGNGCPPVATLVRRFILKYGLDFGAVDAVTDQAGLDAVIDVNPTPFYRHPVPGLVEYLNAP